ncbi:hypothetical protein SteCoe_4137 [Stentor coeruleus]|uniref:Uncharacterized protein n=1 Tax=Stentor coeruleus TaxID=5963 RepID=A0A1R2CVQ5_9CILI|nr:hypothetical protein SteCoe_4137 [Stentor coeruleus]
MSSKINRNGPTTLLSLKKECDKISKDLYKLKLTMPTTECLRKAEQVVKKFDNLKQNWSIFASKTLENINLNKNQACQYMKSMEVNKNLLQEVQNDKKRIKSQEILQKKSELILEKSLDKIKGLWQLNLIDMEKSLKIQKETLKRISKNNITALDDINHEINLVLNPPRVPKLSLDRLHKKISSNSRRTLEKSSKIIKPLKEEILSSRSTFTLCTENKGAFRSHSSRARTDNKKSSRVSLEKPGPQIPEILSPINFSQIIQENNLKLQNTNLKSPSFSSKSRSKLQSALENDSVGIEEIKEALTILKKANLINKNGSQELLKLVEMIKDPKNSSNVELMLQLLDLEGQKHNKNPKNNQKRFKFLKPHTPATNLRARLSKLNDLEGTSREKFKFPDEKSFNRTILSNENLLSPKNYDDYLENSYRKSDLKDVKLEDLLNVASIMDDLGLISAENSIIHENAPSPLDEPTETKRSFCLDKFFDDLPVKISRVSKIK